MISIHFIFSPKATNTELTAVKTVTPAESQGLHFLQTKMQTSQGLIYYSVEDKSPASYSVLESTGQAMEYAALIGNKKLFDDYAGLADKYFKDPSGYYYWKIDVTTKKGDASSAFVDDLRLVKAYFIANEKKLGNYNKQLEKVSETIFQFDIDTDGFPCEYYDGNAKQKATVVPLFYLDVDTLRKLSQFNGKWLVPYQHAKDILLSMPENKHGFYPIKFKIHTKQYVWGSSINMVENLYTAIDAYNAGRDTRALVTFLKNQVTQGKVFNHYYLNGTPVDQNESTAVYALAARFLALNNENEAAKACYRRTLEFQISDKEFFQGGFGESTTGLVYAFDQLEALLMLRMVEAADVSQ
ncbi:hypothetical protein AXX12_17510 [Anaerosporomusa subterranea]|uniref:Uncharacterized protein n=1 Tax=Anaerosporomusa subterranea TaxID=1794912 RepID=A0A154BV54_ANASB|nr:hypothetical protein [Anaerosporomusa subterranea]KYZ77856.1 hypothetical protein AXX12_17510 [Anaerosporomusa subterranea]